MPPRKEGSRYLQLCLHTPPSEPEGLPTLLRFLSFACSRLLHGELSGHSFLSTFPSFQRLSQSGRPGLWLCFQPWSDSYLETSRKFLNPYRIPLRPPLRRLRRAAVDSLFLHLHSGMGQSSCMKHCILREKAAWQQRRL